MSNMTLRKKFWWLLALFSMALVSEVAVIVETNTAVQQDSQRLSDRVVPMLDTAHQVRLAVVQVQQWLTDISATRGLDGLDDGFKEAEASADLFQGLIAELARIDPVNRVRYDAMRQKFDAYYAVGRDMAKAYVAEGPAGGNGMMGQFDAVAAALTDEVAPLVELAQTQAADLIASQKEHIATGVIAVAIASVFFIATTMGIVFIFFGVLKSLPALGEEVQRIAEGDVSESGFRCTRQDEFGALAQGVEHMKKNLRELVGRLNESSSQVQAATVMLASLSQQTEQEMGRQSQEINAIATVVEGMTVSSTQVAGAADCAADSAASADAEVREGRKVVGLTMDAIRGLSDNVEQTAAVVNQLEGESENIGSILEVIRGIAEQTNLLALNAAIEAARAGEQGRGFAVVADEVRTLASRTRDSTQEIYEMINRLQASARNAVQIMDAGRGQTQSTVEQVEGAGAKLEHITAAVQTINEMSREIAHAAREQNRVAEDINTNIATINDASGRTSENAHDISEATDRLAELATNMQALVGRFRM